MLETQNLARKYASICSFRKYTFQCLGHLILLMPAFFAKNSVFCPKKYLYSRQQCESCVRDFLVLFSVFVRQKVTINEKISFTDYASRIRILDCPKLAINWKNGNDVMLFRSEAIFKCFWCYFVSLVKFSCWSQFHVNIITGSRVMTISFYKG